jgi:predicted nuclease with TOPRIM domain
MDLSFRKKPEWDWPPLSPATELVAACRHLEVANRKLEEKWSEGKETQKQMDKQWEELREREVQLRESFTHFNKFVEVCCFLFII